MKLSMICVMSDNTEIVILLDQFRNKAGCFYSQRRALNVLRKLEILLPKEEIVMLQIAHSHYLNCKEGTTELYETCKNLKEKYK